MTRLLAAHSALVGRAQGRFANRPCCAGAQNDKGVGRSAHHAGLSRWVLTQHLPHCHVRGTASLNPYAKHLSGHIHQDCAGLSNLQRLNQM